MNNFAIMRKFLVLWNHHPYPIVKCSCKPIHQIYITYSKTPEISWSVRISLISWSTILHTWLKHDCMIDRTYVGINVSCLFADAWSAVVSSWPREDNLHIEDNLKISGLTTKVTVPLTIAPKHFASCDRYSTSCYRCDALCLPRNFVMAMHTLYVKAMHTWCLRTLLFL
jgi:hypothetical protein